MIAPKECKNIDEVRNCIDQIDIQIIKLLSLRFDYVKEVIKYKPQDEAGVKAIDRYNSVLKKRRQMAIETGLDPDVIENVYRSLLDYFIDEQKKMINLK
jgi:isochorismate pyruvate lyase